MTPVELINVALAKIGESKGITTLLDDSAEASVGLLLYDHLLRAALREFPWPFATKYLDLTQTRGPVWDGDGSEALVQAWSGAASAIYELNDIVTSGGILYYALDEHNNSIPPSSHWTTEAPEFANRDWKFAFRWPDDCLFARRFTQLSLVGRDFDPAPIRFRVGRDKQGLILYTNETDPNLEYTMIDCDTLWTNDIWLDAFTWRLGAAFAPSLSKIPNMAQTAMGMYIATKNLAATVDSKESQQSPDGDAEWIRGRA